MCLLWNVPTPNLYIYITVYVYLFVYTYAYFSAIPFGLYLVRGGPSVRRLWCQEQTIQAFNLPVQKPKSSTWSRAAAEFSNKGVGCTVAHGNTIRMSLVIWIDYYPPCCWQQFKQVAKQFVQMWTNTLVFVKLGWSCPKKLPWKNVKSAWKNPKWAWTHRENRESWKLKISINFCVKIGQPEGIVHIHVVFIL